MWRLFLSVAGGIHITILLIVASVLANLAGSARLGWVLLMIVFWSAGIFGALFDTLTGTKSYWMPHPLGFGAAFILNTIICSILTYIVLWFVEDFRSTGRTN